ncbi:unnamed protein product [Pleuronectes platessa]|uniref:Uncharacterized protein n=1 Tax=Pleuronectes platessa TaxID=8262 RepID=A0A9N7U6T5_PLEPL|nr:unnamed protein product [Pleuronectes platessa]
MERCLCSNGTAVTWRALPRKNSCLAKLGQAKGLPVWLTQGSSSPSARVSHSPAAKVTDKKMSEAACTLRKQCSLTEQCGNDRSEPSQKQTAPALRQMLHVGGLALRSYPSHVANKFMACHETPTPGPCRAKQQEPPYVEQPTPQQ